MPPGALDKSEGPVKEKLSLAGCPRLSGFLSLTTQASARSFRAFGFREGAGFDEPSLSFFLARFAFGSAQAYGSAE
jgi:hypothetical protein